MTDGAGGAHESSATVDGTVVTLVYGSCVARDTFERMPERFRLARYVARQSLISVDAPAPSHLSEEVDLESPFQRRMVEGDLRGDLLDWLEHPHGAAPELLLWDLTDERHGVLVSGDAVVTVTDEAQRSGVLERLGPGWEHLPFGSDEHHRRWTQALEHVLRRVALTPVRRIVLLAPAWAERAADGAPTPPSGKLTATAANEMLERYYSSVEETGLVEVLRLDDVTAARGHQWGLAPFHYDDRVYDDLITALCAASPEPPDSHPAPSGDNAIRGRAAAQAFGRHIDPAADDATAARALLAGRLRIPPHDEHTLSAPIDWGADPFSDRNWRFNLQTLRWADVLRRVGATGYRTYADRHRAILREWLDAHSGTAATPPSRFVWNDMATGLRAIVLAAAIGSYGPEPWLTDALREHGTVLADPDFGSRSGNHALHVAMGLLVAGDVLDEPDWVERATRSIERLVTAGVHDDGVDAEGSIAYHSTNLRWYEEARRRLAAAGRPAVAALDRIVTMPGFLAHATTPAGVLVPIGDSDTRSPDTFGDAHVSFARSRGTTGVRPPTTRALYRDGGYLFSRTSWHGDAAHYSLKFGPSRASQHHGHDDGASVSYAVADRSHLFDSGRNKYDRSALSLYFKTREAHNSVVLDDEPYAADEPTALLRADASDDHEWTVVSRTESGGTSWSRGVYFSRRSGALVVVDRVEPRDMSRWAQHWQLSEGARITEGPGTVEVRHPDGTTLRLARAATVPAVTRVVEGRTDPHLGWRSYRYGGAFAAPVLRVECGAAAGTVVTAFGVERTGAPAVTPRVELADDVFVVTLTSGQDVERLEIGLDAGGRPSLRTAGRS